MMMRIAAVVVVGLFASLVTGRRSPEWPPADRVRPNDNRAPAGVLRNGILTLRLEARVAEWHPDGDENPGALVPAFAVDG
jgi:hypothetical protein